MTHATAKYPAGRTAAALVVAGAIVWFAPAASAHHSAAAHFALEKSLTLDATITKVQFVNPHGYVYFTVPNPVGAPVPWRCEMQSRLSMERLGWTAETIVVGQRITIKGAPARREENVCMLTSFVRQDGIEIGRNQNLSKGVNPLARLAERNQTTARPSRLSNGQPNISGFWLAEGGPGGSPFGPGGEKGFGKRKGPGGKGKGPGRPGRFEPTAAGELVSKRYDSRFDDPALQCNPANIIFGWFHDRNVNEIVQKNDSIVLKYGYMDFVRTVRLNAKEHPRNIRPSTGGDSIGKWEGNVLVVDTVGFKPSVLIPLAGLMHSGQMHVVERFSVDNAAGTLTRDYWAEDTLYLKSPYKGTDVMQVSDEPYTAYKCVELSGKNNIRPKQ